jgi:hypothetical protein
MAREKRDPFAKHLEAMGGHVTDETHTEAPQARDEQHTTDTQQTHDSGTMERYDVRMLPADWRALGAAAKREGSSRGAIIRRLVREYLRG